MGLDLNFSTPNFIPFITIQPYFMKGNLGLMKKSQYRKTNTRSVCVAGDSHHLFEPQFPGL